MIFLIKAAAGGGRKRSGKSLFSVSVARLPWRQEWSLHSAENLKSAICACLMLALKVGNIKLSTKLAIFESSKQTRVKWSTAFQRPSNGDCSNRRGRANPSCVRKSLSSYNSLSRSGVQKTEGNTVSALKYCKEQTHKATTSRWETTITSRARRCTV